MKIKSLMIPKPITIKKSASIQDALEIMKINSIRHLPVVGKNNKLIGFVTLADLKQGLLPSMLGELTLSDIMINDPITVSPDDDIEIAARLIYRYKISGMPVVKGKKVVGIITESDILRAFIDMMGILASSSRIDVIIEDDHEAFRNALHIIHENGGDIINVVMTPQKGNKRVYFFRLSPCDTSKIKEALENDGYQVISAMD